MTNPSDIHEDSTGTRFLASHTVIRSMAVTAHELKSQLTGILLLAEQISSQSPSQYDGPGHLANRITEGGQQMLKSINCLMDAAAGEVHHAPLLRTTCSLSALLRQVVKFNWEYAMRKDIRLRCPHPESKECWGQIDEESIRTAVDNLINNAIKFSPSGTEIQVRLVPHLRGGIPHALIQVKDQGPGLTSEDRAKAFGPFETLSARPTGGESSTGLGLSIVREAVGKHGGKTWIESRSGQGTTVCIDLPLEDPRS